MRATLAEKPQTRGVELLDRAKIDTCVQCGMCLTSCPTYRELGVEMDSPRGRIFLMKAVQEGRLQPDELFAKHMYLCLDCRACETVCPTGVPFGSLVEAARAVVEQHRRLPFLTRLMRDLAFRWLLPHPGRLQFLGAILRHAQRCRLLAIAKLFAPGRLRDWLTLLPDLSGRPFLPGDVISIRPTGPRRGEVALFWGCAAPVLLPNVQRATARVLARYGYEVVVPEGQTCCGALHLHNGLREEAQALAKRNLVAFEAAGGDAVIVNAAGCGATLKEYPELLRGTAEQARALHFRAVVRDFAEFLAAAPETPAGGRLKKTVTYQDPCHLAHGQRVRREPRQLLKTIPDVEFKEMRDADRCCGSAGIYNLLYPGLSQRFLRAKIDHAAQTGAQLIVTANPGCQLQLQAGIRQAGLSAEVVHLAELLAQAYGLDSGG
ncbi:MAG: (Fe-S)-binding protein [candidate division NC10 bacterium]|nr:(Fe-S)-binding protein [candidate division NC10 bacterium]